MDGFRAGTVRVWLIRSDLTPAVLAECHDRLDPAQRRRAAEFLDPVHRQRFIAAHGSANGILACHYGLDPEHIRWRYGDSGKPSLDLPGLPANGLYVNLSHSADLAAFAVSVGREVGVDLQWCSPDLPVERLSQRYYPEREARYVAAAATAGDAVSRFVRLWVRKEAVVKAAGGRLTRSLALPVTGSVVGATGCGMVVQGPSLAGPYRVCDIDSPPGFHAAVSLHGALPFTATTQRWPPPPAPADHEVRGPKPRRS